MYIKLLHIVVNSFSASLFQGVKDSMEIMKDKDALIHIQNGNHQRLLEELDSLVVSSRLTL
jgi:hypothetical protein